MNLSVLFANFKNKISKFKSVKLGSKIRKITDLKQKSFLVALTTLLVIGLGLFFVSLSMNGQSSKLSSIIPVQLKASKDVDLENLDFKNVERFNVPNAKATVVYIPQIHKEPTSNANDATNDKAAVIQKEIYGMLHTLSDKNGVKYVMDETDLYGKMPKEKVDKISNGFSDIDNFKKASDDTINSYLASGGSQDVADQARIDSDQAIQRYERNIYLTGGAAVLASKDPNTVVYGSQNEATINKCKVILQDLVYLESRIKQLKTPAHGSRALGRTAAIPTANVSSILSNLSSGAGTKSKPFAAIQKFAQSNQNQQLLESTQNANKMLGNLSSSKTFEATPKFSETKQVANNPYSNSTDLSSLQRKYDSEYQDFLKIAKDQRSQETADNVEKMMKENNIDSAVLVFGAQHKDQLVQMLNAKGINVIVVTPESENNN